MDIDTVFTALGVVSAVRGPSVSCLRLFFQMTRQPFQRLPGSTATINSHLSFICPSLILARAPQPAPAAGPSPRKQEVGWGCTCIELRWVGGGHAAAGGLIDWLRLQRQTGETRCRDGGQNRTGSRRRSLAAQTVRTVWTVAGSRSGVCLQATDKSQRCQPATEHAAPIMASQLVKQALPISAFDPRGASS